MEDDFLSVFFNVPDRSAIFYRVKEQTGNTSRRVAADTRRQRESEISVFRLRASDRFAYGSFSKTYFSSE